MNYKYLIFLFLIFFVGCGTAQKGKSYNMDSHSGFHQSINDRVKELQEEIYTSDEASAAHNRQVKALEYLYRYTFDVLEYQFAMDNQDFESAIRVAEHMLETLHEYGELLNLENNVEESTFRDLDEAIADTRALLTFAREMQMEGPTEASDNGR